MKRLFVESDGDGHPKDVYICEDGENDRLCTMDGTNETTMRHKAQEICDAVNGRMFGVDIIGKHKGTEAEVTLAFVAFAKHAKAAREAVEHDYDLSGIEITRATTFPMESSQTQCCGGTHVALRKL